ncbi:bacteriophage-type DNA polymerase [Orientia tsutsugamushi str. Ikeda]|uniref:Type-4 uracil-DNA glycosylase n=1 Tax=Orientia tsutsugamushi (strain Ikeda) TaxID=334380 RepID=B3CRN4_ORITI|nr:uracil-DNA glycosylase [Orientia tsutsugamushi]BAG40175.1 bacteriophage-type DNA polymerase [Orientia tsutsugamushi str. Ikeda]
MNHKFISAVKALKWYSYMGIDDNIIYDGTASLNQCNSINISKAKTLIAQNSSGFNNNQNTHLAVLSNSRQLADSVHTLEDLKSSVTSFDGCLLKKTALNTVFGDGIPSAQIMLIGEAPGQNEDKHGIPFCGESGKLLDNMLQSINLSRTKNVYITNTVFWRPPANRRPTSDELVICRPFVEKHIAIINPKLIILVGSTAATSMLGDHVKISKIRQEYFLYKNCYLTFSIPITAIFHPAYMLRQPLQKKACWFDLLKIQQFILQKYITI